MDPDKEDDPYNAIDYGDFGSYFRHKKAKLQLQQEEIAALAPADLTQIFEGVIVYVNGYTNPPVHDIRNMIVQRGGEFTQFLQKSKVTHIIASNLTQSKMKEFRNYKVAKPEWVVESVKANRLLPWHNFSTLRTPQSLTKFGVSITEATSPSTPAAPSPTPEPIPLPGVHEDHIEDNDLAINDAINREEAYVPDDKEEAEVEDESQSWEGYDFDEEMLFEDELETDQPHIAMDSDEHPPTESNNGTNPPAVSPAATSPKNPLKRPADMIVPKPPAFNPYARSAARPQPTHSIENTGSARSNFSSAGAPQPFPPPPPPPPPAPAPGEPDTRHPTLIELSVPWNRLNSSIQPGFVEKFYQSSRLHYLSTWKAKLRDITAEFQKNRVPVATKFKNRTIMHVDFDCFFASVAARGRPELLNKPIGVAHGSGGSTSNSEIASCNYLARDFGVKNGMHLQKARQLCPDIIVVPYEFQQYEDISIEFYKILLNYADELQAVSVDEALVDVTSKCLPYWEKTRSTPTPDQQPLSTPEQEALDALVGPEAFAQRVRDEIFAATGCHASIGIGPNILLAKLATKRAKPHGQYIWPSAPGSEKTMSELQGGAQWLLPSTTQDETSLRLSGSDLGSQHQDKDSPLTATASAPSTSSSPTVTRTGPLKEFRVKDLPGVGYKISEDLESRLSVESLSQLQKVKRDELQRICGMKTGEMLWKYCRGIDETTLASDREKARQSVSAEISWGVRFENQAQVEVFIRDLAMEVHKRLEEIERKGKSVTIKIMKRKEFVKGQWKHLGHGPVDMFSRTGQLPVYTDDPHMIANEALNLLKYYNFNVLDLRGLGIQVLKLNNDTINSVSKSAFASVDTKNQTTLSSAMFQQQQRSGPAAIAIASIKSPHPGDEPHHHNQQHEQNQDQQQQPHADAGNRVSEPKPEMEIDQATFNELPTDIQEDLRRHHQLVFLGGSSDNGRGGDKDMTETNPEPPAPLEENKENKEEQVANTTLPAWSQLDPADLIAMSTPAMKTTLQRYAERRLEPPQAQVPNTPPRRPLNRILGLQSPAKLDASVLDALPEDIRAEIVQQYDRDMENHQLIQRLVQAGPDRAITAPPAGSSSGNESGEKVPVRGDRRGRSTDSASALVTNKKGTRATTTTTTTTITTTTTTRGRPRGRPKKRGATATSTSSRTRGPASGLQEDEDSLSDQESNGVIPPLPHAKTTAANVRTTVTEPELDAEFLAALPPDIRAEVERNHLLELVKTRQQLQDAKLAASTSARSGGSSASNGNGDSGVGGLDVNNIPPETEFGDQSVESKKLFLEKPTLMGRREIGELRSMISTWVQSTLIYNTEEPVTVAAAATGASSAAGAAASCIAPVDEGPNPDDVQSFCDFLARVIFMERDLERVRLILRWLRRRIQENERLVAIDQGEGTHRKQHDPELLKAVVLCSWRQALENTLSTVTKLVSLLYGGRFNLD
ncbi:deoxycytidyl transferase [Gryganskiella cystojenkinii]|nr:deoxycytidyl transferase [Gryganskiella cystojenkinii]